MKRLSLFALCYLAFGGLNGCASFYRPNAVAYIDCEGARCDAMWARAQTWLATNSRYRVQLMHDNVIQTYGPHENVFDGVAYTVTKENQANGKTRIYIRGSCAPTLYGCPFDPSSYTNLLHTELLSLK